jgi:hypothetical protein
MVRVEHCLVINFKLMCAPGTVCLFDGGKFGGQGVPLCQFRNFLNVSYVATLQT